MYDLEEDSGKSPKTKLHGAQEAPTVHGRGVGKHPLIIFHSCLLHNSFGSSKTAVYLEDVKSACSNATMQDTRTKNGNIYVTTLPLAIPRLSLPAKVFFLLCYSPLWPSFSFRSLWITKRSQKFCGTNKSKGLKRFRCIYVAEGGLKSQNWLLTK